MTNAKKAEFLARMAAGRRKAAAKKRPRKNGVVADIGRKVRRMTPAGKREAAALRARLEALTTGKKNPRKRKTAKKRNSKKAAPAAQIIKRGTGANQYWQVVTAGKVIAQYNDRNAATRHADTIRRARRNPDTEEAAAEALYEDFHGRPSNRTIEYDAPIEYRAELAELGHLKELRYEADEDHDQPLKAFGRCQVASTPDGKNLYLTGGNQRVDLESLDIVSDKDYVELGPLTYIEYHTVKGFHDFAPIDYQHDFGEEDGILPVLCYDQLNQALFVMGGNYLVKPEGITN